MRIGPKYKICKRLGSGVFEKCQTQKFMLAEERRSKIRRQGRRPRALSGYGRQLIEKQKVRFTYGLAERQLSRYVKESVAKHGDDPTTALLTRLESRLDNTVYRSGLAVTRALARQMVSHGHITVNGKKVTIPSYHVAKGDTVAVKEGSRAKRLFENLDERLTDHMTPSWLTFDPKKMEGVITGIPTLEAVESPFDLSTVLEYYSR